MLRAMSVSLCVRASAIVLMAGLLSCSAMGWAVETHTLPKMKPVPTVTAPAPMTLGSLRSFEVGVDQGSFSAERGNIPPEVGEFARGALQADTRLHYESPAQGILKFQCMDAGCLRVKAEVTYGEDGPVIWHKSAMFQQCPFVRFRFQPDSKKFAKKMVDRLARDYQTALKQAAAKAHSTKIEIGEE